MVDSDLLHCIPRHECWRQGMTHAVCTSELHQTEADHSAGLHHQQGQPVTEETAVLSMVPCMQLLQCD